MGRPVVLGSSATILLNGQDIAPTDETQIKNKDDVGLLVSGIRFTIQIARAAEGELLSGLGSAIRVKLNIGRTALMQNYIPIWLLRTQITDNEYLLIPDAVAGGNILLLRYMWLFPKPLYVPPGEHLGPLFSYLPMPANGTADPASLTVRITVFGNIADKVPEIVSVPWACFFAPPEVVGGTAAGLLAESKRTDLMNPSPYDLDVERINGRIITGHVDADNEYAAGTVYASGDTTIRMSKSDGEGLIREPTAFAHAFSLPAKAWKPKNCKLPPFSHLIANLYVDYSTYAGTIYTQPQIGLLGSRDMPLSMLGKG